jgi:hypothetical protein
MKRYFIAFLLTVILLFFARLMSTRHEKTIPAQIDNITLTHRTVTENFGDGPVLIVKTPSTDNLTAVVFYSEKSGGHDKSVAMSVTPEGFSAKLESLPKGQKWFYQIQVSKNGTPVAQFPKDDDQFIKFKGHIAAPIIVGHILFMFATIFFGLMAVFTSIDLARGKGRMQRSVLFVLLTLISAFIGGIPLGIAVSAQTFGGSGWGGWPIGHDITDTKTEVLLLFWLITSLLSLNGLANKKMVISSKTYAFLVTISFIVTFITFLIPHSI